MMYERLDCCTGKGQRTLKKVFFLLLNLLGLWLASQAVQQPTMCCTFTYILYI